MIEYMSDSLMTLFTLFQDCRDSMPGKENSFLVLCSLSLFPNENVNRLLIDKCIPDHTFICSEESRIKVHL